MEKNKLIESDISRQIIQKTEQFSNMVSSIPFSFDGYIYNPLQYAWDVHKSFLVKFVTHKIDVLFLGMNPGPFGMMQTGVPFGEINAVKDYLKINGKIEKPLKEHKKRPILGFDTTRNEVSGLRFWGMIQKHFPNANCFFDTCTVFNYCPLVFISNTDTAKNITPDKLPKSEQNALDEICSDYLSSVISILQPSVLIGVGKYSEQKLQRIVNKIKIYENNKPFVTSIIHPSPANPKANSNWIEKTENYLCEIGIWK